MKAKKLFWIIPVALTGVIVLVLGGIYLSIMDHGKSDFKPEEITNKQLLQRQLVRSFSETQSKKAIDYKLDQDCLNQLLYNATEGIREDATVNQFIGDFYVKIKGNNYKFYVNANLKIVKTRVILDTQLVEKDTEYIFQIKNIKLGNFPAKWIVDATGVLKKVDIGELFEGFGLSIKADVDNHRLVYAKEDMRKDVVNLLSSPASASGTEQELLKGAIETFEYKYEFDNGIHVTSDLSNNIGNSKISDDRYVKGDTSKSSNHNIKYDKALEKIDNTITNFETSSKSPKTTEEDLAEIAKEGFESLRTLGDDTLSINDQIHDEVTSHPVDYYESTGFNADIASVTENDIDNYLRSTDVIGKHFIIHYKQEISYIVVDNMFCDIFTRNDTGVDLTYMNFTIGININGLETHTIIETECNPEDDSFKANFNIKHVYYGEAIASETLEKVIKEIFKEAVNPESNKAWITYDGENDTMSIDFEKILDLDYLNVFDSKGTKSFYLDKVGSSVEDNGALQLWFRYTASV